MPAIYECMIFPQPDGTFTMNVTISTGFRSKWTSPEAPVAGATFEEARVNARAEVRALRKACEVIEPVEQPAPQDVADRWDNPDTNDGIEFADERDNT